MATRRRSAHARRRVPQSAVRFGGARALRSETPAGPVAAVLRFGKRPDAGGSAEHSQLCHRISVRRWKRFRGSCGSAACSFMWTERNPSARCSSISRACGRRCCAWMPTSGCSRRTEPGFLYVEPELRKAAAGDYGRLAQRPRLAVGQCAESRRPGLRRRRRRSMRAACCPFHRSTRWARSST